AFGSVAEGISKIRNPLISWDTLSSLNGAMAIGASVERKDNEWGIRGNGGKLRISQDMIDMGNSGTSLRIFCGLASLADTKTGFDGDSSLRTRPMNPLLSALEQLGAKTESKNGFCPLSIQGPIKGGNVKIECKSSQYLTSLLIALPLAKNDSKIEVTLLNEAPYVEITLDWLRRLGIAFEASSDLKHYTIKGQQKYKAFECLIPGDFSTATFPLVAAAVTGGEVKLFNLDFNDRQGDKEVFSFLQKMGATIIKEKDFTIVRSDGILNGGEFDLNATPDALPAMAVAACCAKGKTVLKNVPQARIKETDRIACMTCELRKMGANIEELPDGMIIYGGQHLHGAELESYGDHRIAMSLAIAAFCAEKESIIKSAESASVTYPAFFEDFRKAGAKISFI
ncbi:MAG: 3-phosphoshikimate 1-carboxyvinyltransferase, partial [Candidatus Nanoarchaeia archaeon]